MARRVSSAVNVAADLPRNTFVLDNGAYTIKAGFASQADATDTKRLVECSITPNCLVKSRDRKVYIGVESDQIAQWSEAVFRRPVEHGQIVSWEAEKEIWEYSFLDKKTAKASSYIAEPEATTLVLCESPNTIATLQKNADEIIMEDLSFGGYMRTIGPSLNAYNNLHPLFEDADYIKNETTDRDLPMECLLVIDSGYSYTTITPCYRGRPIQRAVSRVDFGGKQLTNLLKETISLRHFDLHQDTKIVNDIKEDVCFVSMDIKQDLERSWKGSKISTAQSDDVRLDYILPDGMDIIRGFSRPHNPSNLAARKRAMASAQPGSDEVSMTLANERFTIPEIIFNPSDIGSKQPGLADAIVNALSRIPPLIQAMMLANTLVVGGTAKIPGFIERLEQELRERVKTEWRVRVRSQQDPITSTWLGGARLAQNHWPVVQNYAVTREQYQEIGSSRLNQLFAHGRGFS